MTKRPIHLMAPMELEKEGRDQSPHIQFEGLPSRTYGLSLISTSYFYHTPMASQGGTKPLTLGPLGTFQIQTIAIITYAGKIGGEIKFEKTNDEAVHLVTVRVRVLNDEDLGTVSQLSQVQAAPSGCSPARLGDNAGSLQVL